jgi:hypothetical protein
MVSSGNFSPKSLVNNWARLSSPAKADASAAPYCTSRPAERCVTLGRSLGSPNKASRRLMPLISSFFFPARSLIKGTTGVSRMLARRATLRSEQRSALKKDLTGPTLLEMSGTLSDFSTGRWTRDPLLETHGFRSAFIAGRSQRHGARRHRIRCASALRRGFCRREKIQKSGFRRHENP